MSDKKVDITSIDAVEEELEEEIEDQDMRKRRSVAEKYQRKKPGPKKRLKETQAQTIMFEVDELEKAEKIAHQKGVSRSEYIRSALRKENHRQQEFN